MARSLKSCLAVALLTFNIGAALNFYFNVYKPVILDEYYKFLVESQRCCH